jgi:NitT/TauT family transport system substrate-binding protein
MMFNCTYTTETFADKYPEFMNYFYSQLQAATGYINKNTDGYCAILSQDSGGKVSASQFREWLKEPGIEYSTVPRGVVKVANFMHQIGMLNKAPSGIGELELPLLKGAGD